MDFQLSQAEAARLKRTPAANPDAEDLALQCDAGTRKAGWIGKDADAAYALCDQALAIDPNNVRALRLSGLKFLFLAALGLSSDPKGDLERADRLETKALALDPDYAWAHVNEGVILQFQGRTGEAVAEHERALALDGRIAPRSPRSSGFLQNEEKLCRQRRSSSTHRQALLGVGMFLPPR